jgi:hypothetical protein
MLLDVIHVSSSSYKDIGLGPTSLEKRIPQVADSGSGNIYLAMQAPVDDGRSDLDDQARSFLKVF